MSPRSSSTQDRQAQRRLHAEARKVRRAGRRRRRRSALPRRLDHEGWNKQKEVFDEHFANIQAANFGIGGDRTQHVLWRIENGELEPTMQPKLIVLMIGTNNSAAPTRATRSPEASRKSSRRRAKDRAKVLLLGDLPPRRDAGEGAKPRE
jgi:lysophospholipase L1-like esterase